MAPSVYVLLHLDPSGTPTVLSVYSDLADANAACLKHAADADTPAGSRSPRDLQRWEAPDGTTCWVEKHSVVPRSRTNLTRADLSPKRKDSGLYDNDEDDVIELADKEGNYD